VNTRRPQSPCFGSRKRFAATLLATALLVAAPPSAAHAAALDGDSQAQHLARIVSDNHAASKVQSVLFGVWVGEKPIVTVAEGDSMGGVPATTAMHIRAGIVQTEALTTILLQLVDRGEVSLDAPISTWLPSLPHASAVTLRMLGNSRSGYGDFLADKTFQKSLEENPFQTFTQDQLIEIAMKRPMTFAPGTGFHYAHTNAVLLGAALQHITGKSVAVLMQERIIGPLHLHETQIPASSAVQEPVQHVFTRERGPYEDSTYWDPSWAMYSGTITSTIHDVAVMQRAFGSGALVSKAAFAAMVAPTNAGSPPQTQNLYYGLGVIVGNTWILQHAQVDGSDVVMGYLPARDLTIVVSTAIGPQSAARAGGYSLSFFKDAAAYLAPERPLPPEF
jgi:D-alanyl-D-alanine carboxypeptidase